MRVIINGCAGRMGKILEGLVAEGYADSQFAAGIDPSVPSGMEPGYFASFDEYEGEADVVVDFSHHSATPAIADFCRRHNLPVVVATTGHTEEEKAHIQELSKSVPVFFSANMSLGVAVLVELSKTAAKMFPDAEIEIIERHHDQKLDVPSGTALMIYRGIAEVRPEAQALVGRHENGKRTRNEIGIHSLRYGNEVGTHEVIISTGSQTITLKHEAEHRSLFGEGALTAAKFIASREPGLYNMDDLMKM